MLNNNGDQTVHGVLATRWAKLIYIIIQVAHDFAYFGFITIQPLIINQILSDTGYDEPSSFAWTIFIISSHLIFQVVFETPTGAFADNRGRMFIVLLSFIARVTSVLCLILAVSMSHAENTSKYLVVLFLVIVQILMAIGEALFTGSIEAWLVDTLKYFDSDNEIGEAFSSAAVKQNAAILIAMPLFIFLYFNVTKTNNGNIYFTLFSIIAVFVIGGFVAFKSRDEVYRQTREWRNREKTTWIITLKQCKELVFSQKIILWWMILIASPLGAWILVSWMWTILQKTAFKIIDGSNETLILASFGLVLGIARIGGSWVCQSIQRFVSPFKGLRLALVLNLIILLVGSAILLVPLNANGNSDASNIPINAGVFLASFLIAKGLEEAVKIFNQIVLAKIITDSTVRATAISFAALLSNLTAFMFIIIAVGIFSPIENPTQRVGTIVGIVALAGLLVAIISLIKLSKLVSFSNSKNSSVDTESDEISVGKLTQVGEEAK